MLRFSENKKSVFCLFTGQREKNELLIGLLIHIKKRSPAKLQGFFRIKNFYKDFTVVVEVTFEVIGKSCPIAETVPEASPLVVFD